jgi:membrane-associated protein
VATDSATEGSPARRRRRHVWAIVCVVAVLVVAVLLHRIAGSDGFSLVAADRGDWTYLMIFLLVYGDGVFIVLPGETTLNAAATLASSGELSLGLVMIAGALGAIGGDLTVYLLARRFRRHVMPQYEKLSQNRKAAAALELIGSRAPILIVSGRYVPGLRWVVSAAMGLQRYPLRRFLLWETIGGTLWSVYTCALAYLVATALAEFPLASVVISGLITTAALAVVFVVVRRHRSEIAAADGVSAPIERR